MDKSCCHTHINEDEAKEILGENGLNRTKVKTKVLLEISKASKPISVAEIHQKFKNFNCDISTVFRTITQFKEKNIVQEVNLGEGFFRYEMINHDHKDHEHHHHHHVRCRNCGDIKLIEKCDISIFEKMISKLGYTQTEHRLEFIGLCPKCSK